MNLARAIFSRDSGFNWRAPKKRSIKGSVWLYKGTSRLFWGIPQKTLRLEIITDLKPTVPENPQALKGTEAEALLPGSGLIAMYQKDDTTQGPFCCFSTACRKCLLCVVRLLAGNRTILASKAVALWARFSHDKRKGLKLSWIPFRSIPLHEVYKLRFRLPNSCCHKHTYLY